MTESDRSLAHPLTLETLAAYRLGELAPDEEERVEAHYFDCAACSARLRFVESLVHDVAALVREGRISAAVTPAFLDLAIERGVTVRRYDLDVGESVECTVSPQDDLVVTRLGVPLPPGTAVDIETEVEPEATGGVTRFVTADVSVDAESGGVIFAHSSESIRAYPKSRVVLRVRARESGELFGPYTMNHTPWEMR
jgi:anti-sigma factor RsiW